MLNDWQMLNAEFLVSKVSNLLSEYLYVFQRQLVAFPQECDHAATFQECEHAATF